MKRVTIGERKRRSQRTKKGGRKGSGENGLLLSKPNKDKNLSPGGRASWAFVKCSKGLGAQDRIHKGTMDSLGR